MFRIRWLSGFGAVVALGLAGVASVATPAGAQSSGAAPLPASQTAPGRLAHHTDGGFRNTSAPVGASDRQGRGDFGQNAVHIRELQDAMDAALTREAAI